MDSNLYRYILRRSLRLQITLVVAVFTLGFLNPYMLGLTKQIINTIRQGHLETLLWLCGLYLGAVLATGGLKYLKQNIEGRISETLLRDLRTELYHRILRFPLPHIRNTSVGQLVAMILGEAEDLGQFFGEAFSVPLFHGLMLLGSVGFMFWQNPWMALAGIALFPVQMWLVRKLQRRVIALSRDRVKLVRGLSDRIQESAGTLQEIHANDTLAYESDGFRGQLARIFRVRLNIYRLKYLVKWLNNFLEKLGIFLLLLLGGWLIITRPSSFDIGGLVAFLEAYRQLNEPWRELINYIQQKDNAHVKYEQVIASFDPPGLRPEFPLEERLPDPAPQLAGAYELRGATIAVDGGAVTLESLQLAIPPHGHFAIVGGAQSGKTALTLALAKLVGYTGTILLDAQELRQVAPAVAGRQIAYVGSDIRLFTGTLLENLIYGLRHQPIRAADPAAASGEAAASDSWLDLSPLGATDRAALRAAVVEAARIVGLEDDLFAFGLRATIDPAQQPEIAERILAARRLVMERFRHEGGEIAVEFFDSTRFAAYASIGENIAFGHSDNPALAAERLAGQRHFRRVIAAVGLETSLLTLGANVAKEMVEIFKDISPDNELFVNYSLIAAAELPEFIRLVSRLERADPAGLSPDDQERLLTLALRVVPARHRLGEIDDAFMANVVAARRRFVETMPEELGPFVPYDRERYFSDRTLMENLLFGRVQSTSNLAVKRVSAIVEELILSHDLRDVVLEAGLTHHVGVSGSRLSPVQRQKVGLARALIKRPRILLLDEPLKTLEPEKREAVQQRLSRAMQGRTMIAVLADPNLARYYDRVMVVEAGKIVETGTYAELAAREGPFRRLLAQAAGTSGGGNR
jgi:ABC-type multidrug transport system fused ATPase/permease subunit